MNAVNLRKLRMELVGKEKIPKDFQLVKQEQALYDRWGGVVCITEVRILKSIGGSHHRIYAKCPDCEKFIPVGRLQQHHTVHEI